MRNRIAITVALFVALMVFAVPWWGEQTVKAQGEGTGAIEPKAVYLPLVQTGQGQATLLFNGSSFPLTAPRLAATEVITFTPTKGIPGATITVHGLHFDGVVMVLFGSVPATFTVISETELTAIVPVGATAGQITVVTLVSSAADFIVGAEPTVTVTATPGSTSSPTASPTETDEPNTPGSTSSPTASATEPVPATATSVPPTATATTAPGTATPVPPTATPVPGTATPGSTSSPTAVPEPAEGGIWISQAEIMALPATGAAFNDVKAGADENAAVDLSNQDANGCADVMASALIAVRLNNATYQAHVITGLNTVISGNTESGTRALALGRNLVGCVIAADIIQLKTVNPTMDTAFRAKIKALLTYPTTGGPANIIICGEDRPNNWGKHCNASNLSIYLYLGDSAGVARIAQLFDGWTGNRAAYAGFTYGELWWQADPAKPVGIDPLGSTIQGHNVSGAQPEEMRRAGSGFTWPPIQTDYAWEGLQGATEQAKMLTRAGYPGWQYNDQAILRAVNFLDGLGWLATGDDQYQVWMINKAYGTHLATIDAAGHGKGVGWTSWTDR